MEELWFNDIQKDGFAKERADKIYRKVVDSSVVSSGDEAVRMLRLIAHLIEEDAKKLASVDLGK